MVLLAASAQIEVWQFEVWILSVEVVYTGVSFEAEADRWHCDNHNSTVIE